MRLVAVPKELVALLVAWRAVQAEVRLTRGSAWLDLDLVFTRLGHANETLVLRTYGHLIPGMDRDAVDRLAETLQFTRSAHQTQPGRGA